MFADPEQMATVSTGAVPRYEAEPGGQMTAILELLGIPHGGDQGRGGFGADPFYLGDLLTGLALLKHARDPLIKVGNAQINLTPGLIEVRQAFPEKESQAIIGILQDLKNHAPSPAGTFAEGDAAVEQQAAHPRNQSGPVVDQPLPCAVQRLYILLLHCPEGNEAHVGALDGLTKSFRIVAVILIPLHEGLYILRADDADAVSELLEGSGPVKGTRAGLDRDQAGFRIGHHAQQPFPANATLQCRLALGVDAVQLKDILGQVNSQNRHLFHLHPPLRSYELPDYGASSSFVGRGAVHPIRWKRRYDPDNLRRLEDGSHRPHRRRQPTWTAAWVERVLELRRQYPRWEKDKLVVLLRREACSVSTSMVGRILSYLKKRGVLVEPPRRGVRVRGPRPPRPWAVRKPRDWRVEQPGDLVEVDTMDLRPVPGVVLKQFTARDVVSRWDVVEVRRRATSSAAAFLDTLQQRLPFPLRALQVDVGSEFAAAFEEACRQRRLPLFVLPPRSPKLNGHVERANPTHTEEFHEVTACSLQIAQLNQELQDWERTYNTVRPHQALGYRTPQQFLAQGHPPSHTMRFH